MQTQIMKSFITIFIVLTIVLISGCGSDEEKRLNITVNSSDPIYNFKHEQKYAIVVAVDDYVKSSGFRKLKYSVNDAKSIKAELEKNGYDVILLTNDDAHKHFILKALDKVKQGFSENKGTLLFTFSGHGYAENGKNYLATKGTTAYNLSQSGLSLDDIKELMNSSGAKKRVMFIDACRNNAFPNKALTSKGFVPDDDSEGINILYSTKEGKVSYEASEYKHSFFSYFLVKGFQHAKKENGVLTFYDLSQYVTQNVKRASILAKATDVQTPYRSTNSSGRFILSIDNTHNYYTKSPKNRFIDNTIEKYSNGLVNSRNSNTISRQREKNTVVINKPKVTVNTQKSVPRIGPRKNPPPVISKKVTTEKYYTIQVAALKNKSGAKKILNDLLRGGFSAYLSYNKNKDYTYVLVGKYESKKKAEAIRKDMKKHFPFGRNVKRSYVRYIAQ